MQDKSLKYHFIDIIYLYIFFIFSISVKSEEAYEIYNTTIINSHWLNHFITLGINNDAYVNMETYSNGDLIVQINEYPESATRKFFGITYDGKPLFSNEQYFASILTENEVGSSSDTIISDTSIVIFNGNKSEYLNAIIKGKYFEIYDLKFNGLIEQQSIGDNLPSSQYSPIFSKTYYYNNQYKVLTGYISSDKNFYMKSFIFDNDFVNNVKNILISNNIQPYFQAVICNCFITELVNIICFTQTPNNHNNLLIYAYNESLIEQANLDLEYTLDPNKGYYIDCIHLKKEIGVFIYFKQNQDLYPYIIFKQYNPSTKSISDYTIPDIYLNNYRVKHKILLNDIVKIDENKICFISADGNKENLFIYLISIINDISYCLRCYKLEIYNNYNFKFFTNFKAHNYNNMIAFAFSYCKSSNCEGSYPHYASFMIFSYPNGTNTDFDLIKELNNDNYKIIEYIPINLKENVRIDNNIFGLIYSSIIIKKLINCQNLSIISLNNANEINSDYILKEDDDLEIMLINYASFTCKIEYIYNITEPDYIKYVEYSNYYIYPENKTSYSEFFETKEKRHYSSRLLYFNIIVGPEINNLLTSSCADTNCNTCLFKNPEFCVKCSINSHEGEEMKCMQIKKDLSIQDESTIINEEITTYNFDMEETFITTTEQLTEKKETSVTESQEIKEKEKSSLISTEEIEKIEETSQITDKIKQKINETIKNNSCTKNMIINNECINGKLNNIQIKEIYQDLKENILKNGFNGNISIIQTENVKFQISTYDYQKNQKNPNISTLDLGKCENILKDYYNISKSDSLIIFKMDAMNINLTSTFIQYEIYEPYEYKMLNLSLCDEVKIEINNPIKLNNNTISLYQSLNNFGYNLFDSGDKFYNDICSIYTTNEGTDIILNDRKKYIFSNNGNINICQSRCIFDSYNLYTRKAKCNCDIQTNEIDTNITEEKFLMKILVSNFMDPISNSNFRVLQCYKLVLNFNHLFKNIGRIIMSIIYILYIITFMIYIINERKKIKIFINNILKEKKKFFFQNKEKKTKEIIKKNKIKKYKRKTKNFPPKRNIDRKNNNAILKLPTSGMIIQNQPKPKTQITKINNSKNININIFPNKCNENNKNNLITRRIQSNKKLKNKSLTNNNNANSSGFDLLKNKDKLIEYKNLNEEELNNLDYKVAVFIDKRTLSQYYCSLLKKKHLILFTVMPAKDYNLKSLKYALFLLSFSLYFTINGFFFSDSTMHEIYIYNGKFSILFQIPQIFYTSIISSFINLLLKTLSLSEKNILELKQEKNFAKASKNSLQIEKKICIKFILFFVLSNFLLLFFWYFISCFCAVYINTQIILIKDTLTSFLISMIYPFGLNIVPGLFRIPSLKSKKGNKKYLYTISKYISLI